jgi:hypothetical protein
MLQLLDYYSLYILIIVDIDFLGYIWLFVLFKKINKIIYFVLLPKKVET